MNETPRVILSGFADEAANKKTAGEQFVAFAALGLQYYSIRFIDVGQGVKNVMKLSVAEIQKIRQLQNEYGLNVSSIGSPIGKVKLVDVEDGTKNAYVPFEKYLASDVQKACELAHAFETKLIRGFSFYHPKGSDPREHLPQVVDQLGPDRRGLPPLRPDFRPGSRGEPGGQQRPDPGRDLPPGEPSGHGADLRRRQHPHPGLLHGRGVRAVPGDEAGPGLDAHQGLSQRPSGDQGGPRRGRQAGQFRARRPGRFGPRAILRDFRQILPVAGEQARPPRHPRRVPRPGAAPQRRRAVRRLQRPGRHGRRPPRSLPRAGLRGHRLPPPRLRRRAGCKGF